MKYPEIYVQANVCFLYIWKQTTIFEEDCSHLLGKEDSQTEGSQYQKCPPSRVFAKYCYYSQITLIRI